ncbi:MAG TPA: glycosyltransferase, partial [Candidatus Nanoarchaeia archaeon]|nr:glycosyltransferase [Candidatus Nanoarchaeia archaeon]
MSFLSLFLAIFWIIVLYTKIASAPGKAESSKKITILVPALNEEQTIARTITSLQASLYKNIEIIVI